MASSNEGGAFNVPSLPKLDMVIEKMHHALFKSREEREKQFGTAFAIFFAVGLQSIQVHHIPVMADHHDSERLRQVASVPLRMVEIEMHTAEGSASVTREEFEAASVELESWLKDPTAFWMVLSILTVGKCPM